jgi:hypothetical protein
MIRHKKLKGQSMTDCPLPKKSVFFDGNGALLTNLDTGLTTQTLFFVHDNSFSILEFINFNRTDIDTLATANTLVNVNGNRITHDQPPIFSDSLASASRIVDPYTRKKSL